MTDSQTIISTIFQLYDVNGSGYLEYIEVKNLQSDLYKDMGNHDFEDSLVESFMTIASEEEGISKEELVAILTPIFDLSEK